MNDHLIEFIWNEYICKYKPKLSCKCHKCNVKNCNCEFEKFKNSLTNEQIDKYCKQMCNISKINNITLSKYKKNILF